MAQLRKLAPYEIEWFASRPSVDRLAVEIFLAGIETDESAVANLCKDRDTHNWNYQTVLAICSGIQQAMKKT